LNYGYNLTPGLGQAYAHDPTDNMWMAWQARAALAAHPTEPQPTQPGRPSAQAVAWAYDYFGMSFSEVKARILAMPADVAQQWAAPPAAQPVVPAEPKPDMFWNDADPERSRGSIFQIVDDAFGDGSVSFGDVMTIQRAIRLPNVQVRVVPMADDPEYPDYEFVAAAPSVALVDAKQPLGDAASGPGSTSLRSSDPYRDLPTSER
jgi:hypothetical protein